MLSTVYLKTTFDFLAQCIESPGYWALAFTFLKALPVERFTADFLSIYFCAVRLICGVRHLCERFRSCLHSSIHFSLVRLRICASWNHLRLVRFIFEAFDLLFGGSIYFCAVPFKFVQVGFICTSFDLHLRGSIDFLRF